MTTPLWPATVAEDEAGDRDELEAEIVKLVDAQFATSLPSPEIGRIHEIADQYPIVRFKVPGIARPQGSKKGYIRGKHVAMVEANTKLPQWRTDIAKAADEAMAGHPLLAGPLLLDVVFVFVRPQSHFTTTGKLVKGAPLAPIGHNLGDLSKLVRAIEDAMQGIVYKDDCQFSTMGRPRKRWGLAAATYITVMPDPLDP
jgi:hypothetical protein